MPGHYLKVWAFYILCMNMTLEYTSGAGLAMFSMGISFLWNRINFIKKANIAIATLVKLEEFLDAENTKYYIPHFKFQSHSFKEIIYKHTSTQRKSLWKVEDQIKIAYKEGYFDDHEIVMLSFLHAFGLPVFFSSVGVILLIVAGGIYWNVSGETLSWFIPGSIVSYISVLNVWSNRFFKTLH